MAGEKILVVDDDEQVASYVQLSFTLNGYTVEYLRDGREALSKAREILPDAIILDLKMPGMNGFRVCELLREDPKTRAIPIVVVSGSWKNAEDRIRSIEAGADDFLTKPFDAQELIARVKRMLQRKKVDMGHNPLTGLPGNVAIEEEARRRLATMKQAAFGYLDMDNFKAYNDVYGIKQGDKVIRLMSELLQQAVKRHGNSNDFIGHIGGDDFIVITTMDKAETIFNWVAGRFDERVRAYYSDADLKEGCITAKDRQGNIKKFPFISLSIVYTTERSLESNQYTVLIQALTEMKGYVKHNLERKGGSLVFQDRRAFNANVVKPAPPPPESQDKAA
ncbi:MAG: response regulator [Elusimicrobia bacterium]|nr:response regulator [Candidatus Obscuribacterium magneticum]